MMLPNEILYDNIFIVHAVGVSDRGTRQEFPDDLMLTPTLSVIDDTCSRAKKSLKKVDASVRVRDNVIYR